MTLKNQNSISRFAGKGASSVQVRPRPRAEKAVASAVILHPTFWGVNKLRPLNFNARN
jgi:hypothetical protein